MQKFFCDKCEKEIDTTIRYGFLTSGKGMIKELTYLDNSQHSDYKHMSIKRELCIHCYQEISNIITDWFLGGEIDYED